MENNSLEDKLDWKDLIPGYSTYVAWKYNIGSKFASRKDNIGTAMIFDYTKGFFYFFVLPMLAYEGLVGF